MKVSEWNTELKGMTDEALETAYVSLSKLLTWDAFKDNFSGARALKSLISCEQMSRRIDKGGTSA